MAEYDYVVRDIEVKKKGEYDLKELYTTLKDWLNEHGYDIIEKEYEDLLETGKDLRIKWKAMKKLDDYTQFVIEVTIKVKDWKEVEAEAHKLVSGNLEIKFESYFEKDYEERWELRPLQKFMRGVFDKFVLRSKWERLEKDLKEETFQLRDLSKQFLDLIKY